jgi:hypothetical protein
MATLVECPSCRCGLRVPEEMFGTNVKCPGCGGTFEAGPAGLRAVEPDPAAVPAADGEAARPLGTPYSVTPAAPERRPASAEGAGDVRPCPYCGERITTGTYRCPFCGEDLAEEDERPWERPYGARVRRDSLPHRGALVLVFGILSFVLPYIVGMAFGIAAWVMGHNDLKRMKAGEMDPAGTSLTKAGWICGIIGAIFQGTLTLIMVGWIVAMILMVSAMPPPTAKVTPMPAPAPVQPVQPPAPRQPPAEKPVQPEQPPDGR